MPTGTTTLKSVDRTFRILEYVRENEPVALTTIAEETGTAKSTVHRYLSALIENRYVVREDDMYRVSFEFLRFANSIQTRDRTYPLIQNKVREIARETGELVQFTAEECDRAVYLFEDAGSDGLWIGSYTRTFRPLHATAGGKSILSTWEEEDVEAYAGRAGLPKLTERTIDVLSELLDELQQVRERGYATNDEETIEGLNAVAVPITRPDGHAIGALGISGPSTRISVDATDNEHLSLLFDAKNELELHIKLL